MAKRIKLNNPDSEYTGTEGENELFDLSNLNTDLLVTVINKFTLPDFFTLLETNKAISDFCTTTKGIKIKYTFEGIRVTKHEMNKKTLFALLGRKGSLEDMLESLKVLPLIVDLQSLIILKKIDVKTLQEIEKYLKSLSIRRIQMIEVHRGFSIWKEAVEFFKNYEPRDLFIDCSETRKTVSGDDILSTAQNILFPNLQMLAYIGPPISENTFLSSLIPTIRIHGTHFSMPCVKKLFDIFLSNETLKERGMQFGTGSRDREEREDEEENEDEAEEEAENEDGEDEDQEEENGDLSFLTEDRDILDFDYEGPLPEHRPFYVKGNHLTNFFILCENDRLVHISVNEGGYLTFEVLRLTENNETSLPPLLLPIAKRYIAKK